MKFETKPTVSEVQETHDPLLAETTSDYHPSAGFVWRTLIDSPVLMDHLVQIYPGKVDPSSVLEMLLQWQEEGYPDPGEWLSRNATLKEDHLIE